MRICLIYQGEFPRSERIEKEAKSLAADGHEVFLLCNNYGKFAASEEQFGDVHIIRVGPTFASRRLNRILKFPIFFNPVWISALHKVIRKYRIEALHVIDVPLAAGAVTIGHVKGMPVVYDMWENYPEALKGWSKTDWKVGIFKNYRVARAVEEWSTKRADHVFTVVEEARDRLIADGVNPGRVSVVTNGVDIESFLEVPKSRDAIDLEPGAYSLLYVGGITIERGLEDIIRALPLVRDRIPNVRFYIAGSGTDEQRLRSLTASENVSDLVRFTGFIPFEQIHAYITQSSLCLVPHVYNDFINTTIPNKLFQYMALSKPVLVSNAKPLARIVRQCDCGFVFESGNPGDAAAKIWQAYEARHDATPGQRGKQCAEQFYTWDIAAQDLLRVYRQLGEKGVQLRGSIR